MMFYVSLMLTTKQKSTVNTQKINKSKHATTENHQFTKEASKRGRTEPEYGRKVLGEATMENNKEVCEIIQYK